MRNYAQDFKRGDFYACFAQRLSECLFSYRIYSFTFSSCNSRRKKEKRTVENRCPCYKIIRTNNLFCNAPTWKLDS